MAENKPYEVRGDVDHLTGWTVQQGAVPAAPESIPGNVVTADELPYKESLDRAGVDATQYFANVHIAQDEEAKAILRHEAVAEVPVEEVPVDEAPADEV